MSLLSADSTSGSESCPMFQLDMSLLSADSTSGSESCLISELDKPLLSADSTSGTWWVLQLQSFVLGLRENKFVLSVGAKLEKVVKKIWLYSLRELNLRKLSKKHDCTAYCICNVISAISNLNRCGSYTSKSSLKTIWLYSLLLVLQILIEFHSDWTKRT